MSTMKIPGDATILATDMLRDAQRGIDGIARNREANKTYFLAASMEIGGHVASNFDSLPTRFQNGLAKLAATAASLQNAAMPTIKLQAAEPAHTLETANVGQTAQKPAQIKVKAPTLGL